MQNRAARRAHRSPVHTFILEPVTEFDRCFGCGAPGPFDDDEPMAVDAPADQLGAIWGMHLECARCGFLSHLHVRLI